MKQGFRHGRLPKFGRPIVSRPGTRDNYHWNHLDEINQVLGTIGKSDPDPVAFYKQQASRLKGLSL